MKFLYLVSVAALCFVEAQNGASANFIVDHFKSWLNTKIQNLRDDVYSAEALMKKTYQSEIDESLNYITNKVNGAKTEVKALSQFAPQKCAEEAQHGLDAAQASVSSNFFECANLSEAAENVKAIADKSLSLGAELFKTLDSALTGLDKCYPFISEANIKCINDYVWGVLDSIKTLVNDCKTYGTEVRALGKDIAAEINECLHPKNQTIDHEIQKVMTDLTICVKS